MSKIKQRQQKKPPLATVTIREGTRLRLDKYLVEREFNETIVTIATRAIELWLDAQGAPK